MKKVMLFYFVISALVFSCSKETVKTPGQVAADQISSVVSKESITYVVINELVGSYSSSTAPQKFTLSGEFIVTPSNTSSPVYYDLDRLDRFAVGTATLGQTTITALFVYLE
ncbi:hypothetical protein WSM22_21730 [Cytophagales bacterium WSM2-2]|nr:hypothetical protein WSM22_21730 [Cytophagales bacterium WSM2-2]